jgi:hypothetical protein
MKCFGKRVTIDRKNIHIDLNTLMNQVNKNPQYHSLKGGRGIAQGKWKKSIGKCPPGACKGSFLLIL